MSNTLGYYNPYFYANEALIHLENALGMANRVHRGFDAERRSFGKGEYVNITKPSTFSAADAPDTTGQDLDVESVQIQLAYWREVRFWLTDKELAFTTEKIINDHIKPAAYALANDIDTKLNLLYKNIPWYESAESSLAVSDFTNCWKILFDNGVPMNDGNLHMELNGNLTSEALQLSAFTQWQGAGAAGVDSMTNASLGTKFGFEVFSNQNVQTHTSGTCADATGAIDNAAGYDEGDTTIHIDSVTEDGTAKAGDILTIAGHTQQYVITADVTFTGGESDVTISPGLEADTDNDTVVNLVLDSSPQCLAFHRNAFALVTAPLSDIGSQLGAKIASIYDDKTGLALRSRLWYDGNNSKTMVSLDILYGVKTLDQNMAVRLQDD